MRETTIVTAGGLALRRPRPWERWWMRWRAPVLDAALAAGQPADADRFRAARAGLLVRPATRAALAASWQSVLDRADRRRGPADPRVPVVAPRVRAAAADIERLITALRAAAPVPARGVALAVRLLSDGTGPLYRPGSRRDLRAAVNEAVAHLDPATELMAAR
jgi:hypothetical protein